MIHHQICLLPHKLQSYDIAKVVAVLLMIQALKICILLKLISYKRCAYDKNVNI